MFCKIKYYPVTEILKIQNANQHLLFFISFTRCPDQAPPLYPGPSEATSKQNSGGLYLPPYPPPDDRSDLYLAAAGPYPAPTTAPHLWQCGGTLYPPQYSISARPTFWSSILY